MLVGVEGGVVSDPLTGVEDTFTGKLEASCLRPPAYKLSFLNSA